MEGFTAPRLHAPIPFLRPCCGDSREDHKEDLPGHPTTNTTLRASNTHAPPKPTLTNRTAQLTAVFLTNSCVSQTGGRKKQTQPTLLKFLALDPGVFRLSWILARHLCSLSWKANILVHLTSVAAPSGPYHKVYKGRRLLPSHRQPSLILKSIRHKTSTTN